MSVPGFTAENASIERSTYRLTGGGKALEILSAPAMQRVVPQQDPCSYFTGPCTEFGGRSVARDPVSGERNLYGLVSIRQNP